MKRLRNGFLFAPVLGAVWTATMLTCVTVVLAFMTGAAATLNLAAAAVTGAAAGLALAALPGGFSDRRGKILLAAGVALLFSAIRLAEPFGLPWTVNPVAQGCGLVAFAAATAVPLLSMIRDYGWGAQDRHAFEHVIIRFLIGIGYVAFTVAVVIPFFVMVVTSLKSQQELLANPLDYSIELSKGWELFRSYDELFNQFNFGRYLLISAFVSVVTVFVTLLFSIPGAYAVSRLRFRGKAVFARAILLIYMVPMIVLALPIYVGFSIAGLRNTLFGILLIYPVTTIPVALYMLQGYFRGLPAEVEEAGLMDGLSRVAVIWKITLPLSLPALASVSLYVFMIAWNEFLLAFMLLDDPSIFTLTRGVVMLNSSEIPRQHLMAGSVLATVPVMAIFMGLERFMTRGLTAGSVKG